MLTQLIYVSNRKPECDEKEIEKILESCKKNNVHIGISGVLLYNENRFLQLVEGEYKTLISLYDKIKIDKRHDQCFLISCAPIKQKSFPGWHMGLKKLGDNVDIKTDISSSDKELLKNILSGKEAEGEKALSLIKKFFN